ncbi:MAG: hypothetical protein LBB90_10800 [Tannerella sp.]|jgi:hypothetical protein|nr:hypothetical protein [Tannerella sp.]
MVTPENFIKPLETIHANRLDVPTILPASAGRTFVRAAFNRDKTDSDTVKNGSGSLARRFRFFDSLPEATLLILTNIVMGGGVNA